MEQITWRLQIKETVLQYIYMYMVVIKNKKRQMKAVEKWQVIKTVLAYYTYYLYCTLLYSVLRQTN